MDWDLSLRLAITVGVVDGSNPGRNASAWPASSSSSLSGVGSTLSARYSRSRVVGGADGGNGGQGVDDDQLIQPAPGFGGSPIAEVSELVCE